jgi:hypothetical protein
MITGIARPSPDTALVLTVSECADQSSSVDKAKVLLPVTLPMNKLEKAFVSYTIDIIGGRTRTRTLDPLIKSHMFNAALQEVSWKRYENCSIARQ